MKHKHKPHPKPLNPPTSSVYRTLVTFPRSVYDRLERLRGPTLRSHIVTAAVSEHLDRTEHDMTDEIDDQPKKRISKPQPPHHHE